MQLVDDRLVPGTSAPGVVAPAVVRRGDDLARAVDVARLEARSRIGNGELAVDAVPVERAGAGGRDQVLVPAVAPALKRQGAPGDLELDFLRAGRPEPEAHAALRQDVGAEGH